MSQPSPPEQHAADRNLQLVAATAGLDGPSGATGVPAGSEPETHLPPGERPMSPWDNIVHALRRQAVLGVWLVMAVIFAVLTPSLFLTVGTFQTIFSGETAPVFLSLALICTLTVGEFDLSVASILGFASTMVSVLVVVDNWSVPLAVLAALAACTLAGAINGLIVVRLGVSSIVTTLGMGTLLLGIAEAMTHLSTVSGLPMSFSSVANNDVLSLPLSFWYGLAAAAVVMYVLFATALGRHMTFVGANPEVARLAGVRVARIRIGSYAWSGLICGIGGVILVAGLDGFDPSTSQTYLLPAFAAAFLGSTMIIPGKFNPFGAFLAIYFLETGIVGLELLGYTGWISDVFFGAALMIAVTVSTITRRRARRE